MMRYWVQPRNWIFVKGYGFLPFAKKTGKNIGKNATKSLSGKYRHKLLDYAKQSATDALKTTSQKVIQKIAEATGDLIGNEIADRINLLDNTISQSSKFRTRNWVEKNAESRGTYNQDNKIKFKTSMIRSNLYDYSNAYIPVCGTITIAGAGADDPAKQVDERNNGVIFKNCALFTDFISEINNTHIDNAKDIDVGMPIYNLVEYYNNYSQISESLW